MGINNNPSDYYRKIRLLKNSKPFEVGNTQDAGHNAYSFFPDLDGLSSYLGWKYFKSKPIGTLPAESV